MKKNIATSDMRILFVTSDVAGKMAPFNKQQAVALQKEGLTVDHFRITESGIIGYLKAAKRLRRYLKEHSYSLIHAHYSYCGWVADLARRKEKLVVSFIGSDIYGYPDAHHIKKRLWTVIQKLTCLHAQWRIDLTLLMSNKMKKVCSPLKKGIIFPHGVDFNQYFPLDDQQAAREKIGWPQDKKIILFPANPARAVKNFPLAKKAVDLLQDDQVILKSFINVPNDLMNFYYNAADLLLMTSLHEGSPCVIKEAMACNLPIISTDVGDVSEIIANTDGCSISAPNAESLKSTISLILKNNMRTNGREKVKRLELSSVIQKQISLYKSLI